MQPKANQIPKIPASFFFSRTFQSRTWLKRMRATTAALGPLLIKISLDFSYFKFSFWHRYNYDYVPFQNRDLPKMSECNSFQFLDMEHRTGLSKCDWKKNKSDRMTVNNISILCVKVNKTTCFI